MHVIKADVVFIAKQLVLSTVIFIKSYFVVSLTENDGCLRLGSEQCCYHTFGLTNEDMGLTYVAF